jgi:RNA polymerase sigma factor (sigma-70 family)
MAIGGANGVIRHLRRAALLSDDGGVSDASLLESFIKRSDDAAFEALVRRHGAMVLGVCRRILNHAQDAEDAFQATFLVLVRKAVSIVPRDLVGHWLYGVAYRTALKAKTMKSRRRRKEGQAMPAAAQRRSEWDELQPVLDRELNELPEKYRLPIFLCDLQGKKHREAARQLGWPEGTLETRLATGRRLLARRLMRRGITLSSALLVTLLADNPLGASVPAALLAVTLKACASFSAGTAAGVVSTQVIALTEGVLRAMLLTKIRAGAAICLTVAVLCAGSSVSVSSTSQTPAAGGVATAQVKPKFSREIEANRKRLEEFEWSVRTVNHAKRIITLDAKRVNTWGSGMVFVETQAGAAGPSGLYLNNLQVGKEATITLNDKPALLKDLQAGMRVSVRFAADSFALSTVSASSQSVGRRYVLREVAPEQRTITVSVENDQFLMLEKLPVAEDADIQIHGKGRVRTAALKDLEAPMTVHVELGPDDAGNRLVVKVIKATK